MVSEQGEEERSRARRGDFLAGEIDPSFSLTNANLIVQSLSDFNEKLFSQ